MPVASASAVTQFTHLGLFSQRYGSFAGKGAALVEVADGEIIYVGADDRTISVAAVDRTVLVEASDRTVLVPVRPTP